MNVQFAGTMFELSAKPDSCAHHGEFESHRVFRNNWSKCPVCNEIEAKAASEKLAEEHRRKEQAAWIRRIGSSGIPERFFERTLDTYVAASDGQTKALTVAKRFADEFEANRKRGSCLLFVGKPGTGKTHLAAGIALQLLSSGHSVGFVTMLRMMRRVKDTWRRDSEESESDVVDMYCGANLLIIDEVGVQFGSEAEKNIIFDILNERYEKRRPTIFMSNLKLDEVKAYLGERVLDRIKEDGGVVIPFDWESHRGKRD